MTVCELLIPTANPAGDATPVAAETTDDAFVTAADDNA